MFTEKGTIYVFVNSLLYLQFEPAPPYLTESLQTSPNDFYQYNIYFLDLSWLPLMLIHILKNDFQ